MRNLNQVALCTCLSFPMLGQTSTWDGEGGDDAGGGFLIDGNLTAFDTATWEFDIDPRGASDSIVGDGAFHLGGTLAVEFENEPDIGDAFTIILPGDGASLSVTGVFRAIEATGVSASKRVEAVYGPSSVSIRVTCRADVNGDGVVAPSDFNAWILAFNTQSTMCDQNGDGLCSPSDFNTWILNFNAGCP